ncbi:AsnC family transcriptional regulator [Candidatus Woesearchaeota archaeon]|nr:AsnC family transcriptional regulator [Candidatus Woesearchaeota archaeon]
MAAKKGVVDNKDLKILEIVTEQGKVPLKKISSEMRMPKESVAYRLKRLEQLNILRNCVAKINMTKFYQNSYYILFRFRKTSPELLKQRVKILVSSPYVMWVGSLSGKYDLAASFITRDTSDLLDFMRGVEARFADTHYELMTYTREFKNSFKDIFRTAKGLPEPAKGFMMRSFSPEQLISPDDKDFIIIYALSKNARITNAELAKLTGLSEEGVRQRIKQLEKNGIITGYRYLVNIYNMDHEIYAVFLRFENLNQKLEEEIKMYLQTLPEVYYSARFIGRYHVLVGLTARDRFHFQDLMGGLRNRFSDRLSGCQVHIVFGEHKHTYFPPACCKHVKGFDKIEKDFEKKYQFTNNARDKR